MPPSTERRLASLSWTTVREQAARPGSTVLWPLGAVEQHGPLLPLGTDALFAERVAAAVLDRLDPDLPIWRLPLQSLGFSPEHLGFPGTLSLPAELLIDLVRAVGQGVAAAGFRRLVLFNAHGGQIGLLEAAARELRVLEPALAVLPCFLWRGVDGLGALIPEPERSNGLHAGLAETSLMLFLEPGTAGPLPAADGPGEGQAPPEGWSLEGACPSAWRTQEISASGVIGDPSGASEALGRELFGRLVESWERRLEALLHSNWPPTSGGA
ncbi:creatininase family protein [Synechococcus sp. FACHB-909]|uniref:creatininase family protein n=1 Tax=Synechococcus sp. FACHB-909 TaxID=2692863 RepID=UPI0016882A9B|nr:creatininase family protein [Synechococcus sp. FACHB-909]MBD2719756.1 creatininase family protein [Synechococcus sp. FACHB-909]